MRVTVWLAVVCVIFTAAPVAAVWGEILIGGARW
jgi:hypothetical protein